jgi:hypothetical protein
MGNEEILLRVVKQLTFLNLLKSPEDTVDYVVLYGIWLKNMCQIKKDKLAKCEKQCSFKLMIYSRYEL